MQRPHARRLSSAGLVLLLAAAASAPVAAEPPRAEEFTLRYRFRPGQTLEYVVEDASEDAFTRGGVTDAVKYNTKSWKRFTVVSVDEDGSAVLELQIDRVVMQARESEADPIEFDSDDESPPPAQFVGVRSTIGRPMARITVSPTGKASNMQWLLEDVPNPGVSNLSDLNLPTPLPEQPVAVGDRWKDPFQVEVTLDLTGGLKKPVRLQRQYRLESVADRRATISLETAVLTPLNDPAHRAQIIRKLARGTAVLDMKEGRLISRETQVDETVIGFSGPGSQLSSVASRSEHLRRR